MGECFNVESHRIGEYQSTTTLLRFILLSPYDLQERFENTSYAFEENEFIEDSVKIIFDRMNSTQVKYDGELKPLFVHVVMQSIQILGTNNDVWNKIALYVERIFN